MRFFSYRMFFVSSVALVCLFLTGASEKSLPGTIDQVLSEVEAWQERYQELQEKVSALELNLKALKEFSSDEPDRYYDVPSLCTGRLTTESGVPVSTSDRSSQGTVYFTPYKGAVCSVYNGSTWTLRGFSELSLALSGLTSGKNYDVFVYYTGAALALELSAAWTNNTTRADAVTLQNGIYVKSSATTRRLVGTLRASGAATTEDTQTKRFVWNYLHRVPRLLYVTDGTDTWTYNAASWRQARASAANQVEYVVGENDRSVVVRAVSIVTNATRSLYYGSAGVGIDATGTNSATLRGSGNDDNSSLQAWAYYEGFPGLGYHYIAWLEWGHASTLTFWGDNGNSSYYKAGLVGVLYD